MILEKLKEILHEQLGVAPEKITADSDIMQDFGADSLDVVEMLMNVESEWNVIVDDDEIANLHTVGDVERLIRAKIG